MGKVIDLTGQRFGRLVVIERAENDKRGRARWVCRCDCGEQKTISGHNLRNGRARSCGCLQKEVTAQRGKMHGQDGKRLYDIWFHMKSRCYNPKIADFKNYGGRGITVCEEWRHDVQAFYDWAMSHGYRDSLTLDRIDNNGPYGPENCRWTTRTKQANNTRANRKLTLRGETQTVSEWAAILNISHSTIRRRLHLGWSVERALTTPVRPRRKKQKEHGKIELEDAE